jgi:hypothetical protein
LGPEGDRPDRPTQAVRHTCFGKLGIANTQNINFSRNRETLTETAILIKPYIQTN